MNKDDFSALNEMASNGDSEGIVGLFLDEIACQQMLARPLDAVDGGAASAVEESKESEPGEPEPRGQASRGPFWTAQEIENIAGALVSAALNDDLACVQAILLFCPESARAECPDRMKTALNATCRQKPSAAADACFDALLRVSDAGQADSGGRTNLMTAAMHGNERALRRLLLAGADPKHADSWGETALSAAAYNGEDACVRALLPVSEPMRLNERGLSALHQAVINGHTSTALILAPFSDLCARAEKHGGTAFDIAQSRELWACADAVIPDDEALLRKTLDECRGGPPMPRTLALLESIELQLVSGMGPAGNSTRPFRKSPKSL